MLNHFALTANLTKESIFIWSFRKAMFSSNKMISLSELFDLLTLSVVYDVSNCFLKTFTSTRNYSLNVRKSSKKLSSDLLESFTLLVTSFLFIISYQQLDCFLCSAGILLAVTSKF